MIRASLTILFLLITPALSLAAFPGKNGKIIAINRDTKGIVSLSIKGATPKSLVTTNTLLSGLQWAKGGKEFVVASDGGLIYGASIRLQNGALKSTPFEGTPSRVVNSLSFTPDGKSLIVYQSGFSEGTPAAGIYKRDLETLNDTPILVGEGIRSPALSPNGKQVAYIKDDDIYIANVDGSNPQQITSTPEVETAIDWAPNGKKLVFTRYVDPGDLSDTAEDLYIIDIASHTETALAQSDFDEDNASWSPDGKMISFERCTQGTSSDCTIWIIKANGMGEKQISNDAHGDLRGPAWQPLKKKRANKKRK